MELTARQVRRLRRAYIEIGEVLSAAGLFDEANAETKWRAVKARRWALLSAVAQINGGDVSPEEWTLLGREHGYDPRSLGGFFRGREQLMLGKLGDAPHS